jgi:hypothetical protein
MLVASHQCSKQNQQLETTHSNMHGKKQRGLDDTPLFRVGQNWDAVYSEASARLDQAKPIFWLVALRPEDQKEYICIGESSYCSGLFVDENNILRVVHPNINHTTMTPFCTCCTHTFNGVRFSKKYRLELN